MTDVFAAETITETVNVVDTLVGEGKKFKTIDDLATGKLEADRVIQAREQELADLRLELSKRATTEDLIERIQSRQTTPPQSERPAAESQPAAAAPSFTDEDLKARIKEASQELSREEKVQNNVTSVAAKLTEYYGDEQKANQAVNAKARELGMGVEFLQSMAADSPTAFYQLLGLSQAASSATVSHSDVNPQLAATARAGPKPGTYAYYENIRSTQGAQAYFDPKVQQALMRDAFKADAEGRDFYGA